jgi:hypothetical protein
MSDNIAQIHAVCKKLREHQFAGINEDMAKCMNCPTWEETSYGPAMRGCYFLAKELCETSREQATGFVKWNNQKPLVINHGLADPVQFKDEATRKGFIVCIHASFSGITYEVCEPDGTISQAIDEQLEPITAP